MRGTITGLDPRADPATNAVWKFSHLKSNCFRPNDGVIVAGTSSATATPAQWISGLYTPGTLVSDGWSDVFHIDTVPNPKRTREIIVDEPNCTGNIGGWGLNSVEALTNLVFRVPKVTTMQSGPLCHGCLSWRTDVGKEWDLSSVKTVGDAAINNILGMSNTPGMIGILRLPAVEKILAVNNGTGAAFRGLGIGEAELGLNGNLTQLDPWSFYDCNSMTNVVIGTAEGKTLTIKEAAFACSGIRTVYFNGDKPTFPGAEGTVSFGTDQAEGTMTFYVRDNASWAAVLAEADANGGLVAASTLRTKNRQRVVRYSGLFKTPVELQDPRFADIYHETVTLTATDGREGDWHFGEITLAATCSEPDDAATNPRRARFLRWDGVPVALERQNPLTYTPVKSVTVRAVFAHDWLMTTDAEPGRTMDNGFWRICCFKRQPETDHYLGIGQASNKVGKGQAFPDTKEARKGGGDLNLNGDVWEPTGEGTWQKWTVVSCGSMAPWYYDGKSRAAAYYVQEGEYDKLPTRLTFPETLLFYPGELYNSDSWDSADCRFPMTEVICILPEVTSGTVCSFTIGGVGAVSRLVIRAPGLKQLGNSGGIYGIGWCSSSFAATDFNEWDLTGVTAIGDNAFRCSTTFKAKGTLHLPNLKTIGTNAFNSASVFTGLVAGTNGLTLTSLGNTALKGATGLTDLTLGTRALTLGTDVFNCAKLARVRFPGRVLPQATVDAILEKVAESAAAKQVTIYASPFNYWDGLATALTEAEEAVKPADCFGVYREGLRKAWFVTERSPYEPRGLIFFLR